MKYRLGSILVTVYSNVGIFDIKMVVLTGNVCQFKISVSLITANGQWYRPFEKKSVDVIVLSYDFINKLCATTWTHSKSQHSYELSCEIREEEDFFCTFQWIEKKEEDNSNMAFNVTHTHTHTNLSLHCVRTADASSPLEPFPPFILSN